ncbi:hypothetical protein GPECTOR_10g1021 [Gonium pectorale]|uniref:ShKT domain-containing protein n=1 Tax=Gonium pectorale TaxID=33097 RepID=A0A150GQ96_GONPE|nr:hypothetical protein GPECTOR_10g1021 [Gonium pectorale]|eukprot:KXZ51999.1 hypothetical protein GPECTOR_10g1021 [Gonium pectorale]
MTEPSGCPPGMLARRRHAGNCSTHLLQGFHTCLATCGVCPALALAVRDSLNLTTPELGGQGSPQPQPQLVVLQRPGPPPCRDDASGCAAAVGLQAAAAGGWVNCAAQPLGVVGACKATCRACMRTASPPPAPPLRQRPPRGGSDFDATSASVDNYAGGADDEEEEEEEDPSRRCFDAIDMCTWWAARDPRVCDRAASDLQRWWWVAVACRRTCGLCVSPDDDDADEAAARASAAAAGSGAVERGAASGGWDADSAAAAAAGLLAAARYGVQVGEGPDGMPRVAAFEAVTDTKLSSCADKEPRVAPTGGT